MLDLTWKVFCMTGSVDTYLLMKEMENDGDGVPVTVDESADFESNEGFGNRYLDEWND